MSAALGLLAVLVLTAGTGSFVAQEFAYVAADRLALAREAAAGDRRATRALKVLKRLSFMLSGAQLGITVTGLVETGCRGGGGGGPPGPPPTPPPPPPRTAAHAGWRGGGWGGGGA
ncbi:CNNM domain-containing protein, partial [Streptomyces sp. NPDC059837]|uniref:CNNM domain-containing protein n=1 Tax=Streptomyces sp. NPDC059837 TaxID=3346968 RepID=UPI00365BB4AD